MWNIEHLVALALGIKLKPSIPPRTAAGILGLTVDRDKPKPPTLFTIRLFSAATRHEAEERASALRERDPEVTGQVFWNECGPCESTLVRILEPTVGRASSDRAGNEFVVHLGAFLTRPIATAALAELKRKYGLTGTVVELQ